MAHYVDGFVIPLPKKNVGDYRRMASQPTDWLRSLVKKSF
jgi:uncharacterized protein YbaA (DUF1428 family)